MLYVIVLILLLLFFVIAASYEYYEWKTGVATFPTMPNVRKKIVEILKEDVVKRPMARPYRILDLGSGSGQLTQRIARTLPEVHVIGIEIALIPWLRSVLRQRLFGIKNLEYKRLDFWAYSPAEFDAVITYLPGKLMDRLSEKLHQELKPDTLVLANIFPLRAGWEPHETLSFLPFKTKLFLYRQKA